MSLDFIQAETDMRAWVAELLDPTPLFSYAPDNQALPYATAFLVDTDNVAMLTGDSGLYSFQLQVNIVGNTLLEVKTEMAKLIPAIINVRTVRGSTQIASTMLENVFDNYDPDTEFFYAVLQININTENN